ncbi:MAG: sigma factor [Acidobacteria bacterium]|nr:sigma factor [Acidobacteriota bacterium]
MSSSGQSEWIRSALARYEGPLTRYAAHLTGDIERARDVVQDTFLRLCSQKRSWVDDHLAQWLLPYVAIGPWMCGERKTV